VRTGMKGEPFPIPVLSNTVSLPNSLSALYRLFAVPSVRIEKHLHRYLKALKTKRHQAASGWCLCNCY
jgi:hypothetical protein